MRRLKRDMRRVGLALSGLLLFSVLMVFIPISANAYEGISELATPSRVNATPTVDLTVTALAKEQLTLQVKQLQNQLQNQDNWVANNSTALIAAVATVVVALFGISQWAINRRDERRKEIAAQDKESRDRQAAQDKDLRAQAEERFKTAVTALGDENEVTQVGGAILLRSFLNKDDEKIYGRYYAQIFDLAVAYLRPSNTSLLSEKPDRMPPSSENLHTPLPLTPLRQALIVVFREAFPLAREKALLFLDATGIQLDHAYLASADLGRVSMPYSSLRKADLSFAKLEGAYLRGSQIEGADFVSTQLKGANLTVARLERANFNDAKLEGANLRGSQIEGAYFCNAQLKGSRLQGADLTRAHLSKANLSGAELIEVKLSGADLRHADLSGAILDTADLSETMLSDANFRDARLRHAKLMGADLSGGRRSGAKLMGADLRYADLSGAKLDGAELNSANLWGVKLDGADIDRALSLKGTDLRRVSGLTKEQLEACKARGAIIDEVPLTSSSQSPLAPPPPSQNTDAQAPSATPAQVNTPPPSADGSNATSSQQGPGSGV